MKKLTEEHTHTHTNSTHSEDKGALMSARKREKVREREGKERVPPLCLPTKEANRL